MFAYTTVICHRIPCRTQGGFPFYQKQCQGHKTYSTWHWRYPRCFLFYRVKVKVPGKLAIESGDPNINNDHIFLDHVCSKRKALTVANGSNNQICIA